MSESNKTKSILIIDGENFLHKIRDIISKSDLDKGVSGYDLTRANINNMLKIVSEKFSPKDKIYYSARLGFNHNTPEKSTALIEEQRSFKKNLEGQGFEYRYSGNVRSYPDIYPKTRKPGKRKPIFKEKGVDVGMAVDMVTWAFERRYQTIIMASSDSDMQPAVKKCRELGIDIVYLGFEFAPNGGLIQTTNKRMLLRDEEIIPHCPIKRDLLDKLANKFLVV